MSNISEKVINELLTRNANLEYEVERLERIRQEALNYIANNNFYIGAFGSYMRPLVNILEDKKNKKEKVK